MALELVPMEGKKVLTKEEMEILKRRTKDIPPEALAHFTDESRIDIKNFLVRLIVFTEWFHHLIIMEERTEEIEKHLADLNTKRNKLFENISPPIQEFIDLLELCPMEPWLEFDILLSELKKEDLRRFYKLYRSQGIETAKDNPFLMKLEKEHENKTSDEVEIRITPHEIEELVLHFSLEELVKRIIIARKIMSGEFWETDLYNL